MEKQHFVDVNINFLEDFDFDDNNKLIPSLGNDKSFFIFIFAEWCGHCKTASPEIAKLAANMPENIVMCCIDSSGKKDSEKQLSKRLGSIFKGFRGFPHMCVFKNGELLKNYEGKRKAEAIMEMLNSQ